MMNTNATTNSKHDTLTWDVLLETIRQLEAEVPRYEIWISKHIPETDKDGEPIGGFIIPAVLNGWRASVDGGTEKICLISEATWSKYEDIIRRAGFPVYGAGMERIA